jgi:hypothetical protein
MADIKYYHNKNTLQRTSTTPNQFIGKKIELPKFWKY